MGYSNYKKISQVTNRFGLNHQLGDIFQKIKPVKPSAWLKEALVMAREMPLRNEKVKSEKLVSPILSEIVRSYKTQITLFSGEDLTVKSEDDLAGACDFFFALHPPKIEMEAPIISITEAKDEDMDWGIGQCASQMYGARLYNELHKKSLPTIYGCATTGVEWQFLKLENDTFIVDRNIFTDLPQVIGAWHQILQRYTKN